MQIDSYLTDDAVLSELGVRLERTRLERDLTQRDLATEAGVDRKAIQRIESGESVRLVSFIRVLRALGLLDALEQLVPLPAPSPIELLKLRGKERRRASGERGKQTDPAAEVGPWRWGDERPGGGDERPDGG